MNPMDPMMQEPAMQEPMMEEPAMEGGRDLMDYGDDELLAEISDGISDYIHGEARDHVSTELAQSGEDLADTIAAIAYQIMTQTSEQVAEMSPEMVTFDVLIPLATETIDYLIEMADAVGAPIPNEDDLRGDAFIKMIEVHMAKVGDDPEQLQIAQEMLAEMMESGDIEAAEQYVNDRIQREGGDPSKAQAMGEQMLAQPRQDPLAQGVQQGLMDQEMMV